MTSSNIATMTDKELADFLAKKASDTNVYKQSIFSIPRLTINYTSGIKDVPLGCWVYDQKISKEGDVLQPGIVINEPEISLITVRYQYYCYKKNLSSPLFKKFNDKMVVQHKAALLKDAGADPVRTQQIVFSMIQIKEAVSQKITWNPCLTTFRGVNYIVLSNYLKTFNDAPYFAYPTKLSNGKAEKNGSTIYYVIEKITRGEKLYDRESLAFLSDTADYIAGKLTEYEDVPTDDYIHVDDVSYSGEDKIDTSTATAPHGPVPTKSLPQKSESLILMDSIVEAAERCGLNTADLKKFVIEKTGHTTLRGLPIDELEKVYLKLSEYMDTHSIVPF